MIDHAIAFLVAGIVILALGVMAIRGQDGSIDAVRYRAAKNDQLSLVAIIDQDFRNIGSNLSPGGVMYTLAPSDAITLWDPAAGILEFRAQVDPAQAPATVRYEWEETAETVTLDDGTVRPLLEVRRLVDGNISARSTGRVTEFFVELRQSPTLPIFNLEDTREITVRIRSISPLGLGEAIEETRFEAVYRPVNMTREDF